MTLFVCCSQEEENINVDMSYISFSVNGTLLTRSTTDIGTSTHTVNRILVLPFQKINKDLDNSETDNFVPAWNFARQWDVAGFPASSLVLKLAKSFTYKVLVIGYNQDDYDFNNPGLSSNQIKFTDQPLPTTLDNFILAPVFAGNVPELFVGYCIAIQGNTEIGPVFTPQSGTDIFLSGNLKRFVSGLGVYLRDIPGYVKSISLVAERLVKSVQVNDSLPVAVQTPGDGESRIIQKLVPEAGAVRFNNFLLPIPAANKSMFYLDVEYDSTIERYLIQVPDTEVSQSNGIILLPNGAVTISGSYNNINFGFEINRSINLDDDEWDGLVNL